VKPRRPTAIPIERERHGARIVSGIEVTEEDLQQMVEFFAMLDRWARAAEDQKGEPDAET
jgi:hypothetical protein